MEAVFWMGGAGLVAVEKSVLQFPKKGKHGDAFVVGPAKKFDKKGAPMMRALTVMKRNSNFLLSLFALQ